jgi:predicted metalloprotease
VRRLLSGALLGVVALGVTGQGVVAFGATADDREVQVMNRKLQAAEQYFLAVWNETLKLNGVGYREPGIHSYRGQMASPCGTMGSGNAAYCGAANMIYYDEAFLLDIMKTVGRALHSDGDYAPITILAHEMGHAADRYIARTALPDFRWEAVPSYQNEAEADCFAGAVTRMAEKAGHLDAHDLDEAKQVLFIGGDSPSVGRTGGVAHGTAALRWNNFERGYRQGATGCIAFLSAEYRKQLMNSRSRSGDWGHRSFWEMSHSTGEKPGQQEPYPPVRTPK